MKTYTVTEYDMEDYNKARDDMTDEEAVNLLKRIQRGWIPDYNFDGTKSDFDNYKLHMALYKAIDVLSKYTIGGK